MRCDPNSIITLDALVGRLTVFELDNYDNYVPSSKNIEFVFKAKLSLKEQCKKSKATQSKSEEESKESLDIDLEAIEALLAKRYPKGKAKYKGKIPLIYFSCEEVGHIATRCPNKESNEEKKSSKYKNKKEYKSYKDYKEKGKKSYFMEKDFDSSDN